MTTPERDSVEALRGELQHLRRQLNNVARRTADERSESLSLLVRGISNEISNLTATIIGNAALVRNDLHDSHPGAQRLDMIQKAAEEIGRLNKRWMNVMQGEVVGHEPVNLNTLVYHTMLVEEARLAPRIRITRYMNPDLWRVPADQGQLSQMLVQLTLNAIEAIQDSGKVVLRTRNVEFSEGMTPPGSTLTPGRWVLLSVEDDGEGMDESALARAFEPGYSTRNARQGMGLTLVAKTVARHGGHITVTSNRGAGTTVRVYLPALEESAESRTVSVRDLPHGTETILVVDDERMIADVLQETLRRLGYKTLVARNGQEALDLVRSHQGPIDLVLLDMAMPVMGGAEAYPLLKQVRPDVKIVLCTGFEERIVTDPLLERGADAFLLKPFRPTTLAHEIRRVLEQEPATAKKE